MRRLLSILLAAALLLAAAPGVLAAGGEGPVSDAFVCRYAGPWGDGDYRIPRIELEGDGIQALNERIWADLFLGHLGGEYGALASIGEGLTPEPYVVDYDWAVNGDVLSLWAWAGYGGDYRVYSVYNASLSAGRQITDGELLAALGLDEDRLLLFARTALAQEFETNFGSFPDDELKDQMRRDNDSEENARQVRPYLDKSGDLRAIGTVYAPAGAGQYAQELLLLDRADDAPAVSTAGLPHELPADQ